MIIGISVDQETCRILGQVSLNLLYWQNNLQKDILWSEVRLTRKQQTSRPDHLWPELWEKVGKSAKLKEKQKWSHVLTAHGFARGTASPCSFCCKERGIRVVVHGDDILSGGPRSQLGWLEKVLDKHFEAKHIVMGESRSL